MHENSPSQISLIRACERAWAWRYIAKVKGPPDPAQRLGLRLHTLQEDWLRHGIEPYAGEVLTLPTRRGENKDYLVGQMAIAGRQYLPTPGIAHVEAPVNLRTPAADWGRSRIDVRALYREVQTDQGTRREWQAPSGWVPEGYRPLIQDHKTSSDPRRYGLKPADMRADPQVVIYAEDTLQALGVDSVDLEWLYYAKNGRPTVLPSRVTISRHDTSHKTALEGIERAAERCNELRVIQPDPLSLDPTLSSCQRYGGCEYIELCNLSLSQRMIAMSNPAAPASNATQDFKAQIAAIKARKALERVGLPESAAAPPPPPPPVPAAPPPVPQTPIAHAAPGRPDHWIPGDLLNEVQEYLQQSGKPLGVTAMAADVAPPMDFVVALGKPVAVSSAVVESGAINPPEAPAYAPALPGERVPVDLGTASASAPSIVDALSNMSRDDLKAIAMQAGLVDKSSRHGADSLREMLRAQGTFAPLPGAPALVSTSPVVLHQVAGERAAPVPAAPVAQLPLPNVPAPAAPAAQAKPLVCVNCAPQHTGISLGVILAPVIAEIQKTYSVPDYRLIEFGKGPGVLSAALDAYLVEHAHEYPAIIVDARTPEGQACLATLERHAGSVIRGF